MKQAFGHYLMIALLVVGAYMLGVYKTKVEYLQKAPNTVAQVDPNAQPAAKPVDMVKVEALFHNPDNLVFGDSNSKIKFVEFSDTSCPFCHVAAGENPALAKQMNPGFVPVADGGTYVPPVQEIKKLVDEGKAGFLWLYTPGHGNGELGTLALYCARDQGKFWEAHDILMGPKGYTLFNDQVKNDRRKTGQVAALLGKVLDAKALQTCMDGDKYSQRIADDPQIASDFGYSATPTFFINNKVVEGASSWNDSFKSTVDALL